MDSPRPRTPRSPQADFVLVAVLLLIALQADRLTARVFADSAEISILDFTRGAASRRVSQQDRRHYSAAQLLRAVDLLVEPRFARQLTPHARGILAENLRQLQLDAGSVVDLEMRLLAMNPRARPQAINVSEPPVDWQALRSQVVEAFDGSRTVGGPLPSGSLDAEYLPAWKEVFPRGDYAGGLVLPTVHAAFICELIRLQRHRPLSSQTATCLLGLVDALSDLDMQTEALTRLFLEKNAVLRDAIAAATPRGPAPSLLDAVTVLRNAEQKLSLYRN